MRQIEESASSLQLGIAQQVNIQISDFFRDLTNETRSASSLLADSNEKPDIVLSRFLRDHTEATEASLLDSGGKEKIRVNRFEFVPSASLRDRSQDALVKEILTRDEIVLGKVTFSPQLEPLMEIGAPIKSASPAYSGILIIKVRLNFISDIARNTKVGQEGRVIIVDQSANVIAHPDSSVVLRGENLGNLEAVKNILISNKVVTGLDSASIYRDDQGREMFIVGAPLPLLHWGILVESPSYEALALKNRLYILAFISFASSVILLIVLGFSIASLLKTGMNLKKERDQNAAIITHLTDGLIVYEKNLNVLLVNPQAEIILHLQGEEIKNIPIKENLIENEHSRILGAVFYPHLSNSYKVISGGNGRYPEIVEIALPDIDVYLQITTAFIAESETEKRFIKVIRDISREHIISRMKSEFITIAAHQLRTPLSAIKWTFRMLIEGDMGSINKEQKEFLEKGYDANERMIRLVSDLLNAARIEEARFGYEFKNVSLERVIENTIQAEQAKANSRNIKIIFDKPQTALPEIKLDAKKIELALQNLLENSINYTLSGGKVSISLKKKPPYIEVSVKDTGVGIPKYQMHRLFTKFFRGDNVIRMQTEGSGLGLFIVKNIIINHGGNIWVESEEGKGSAFFFTLPIEEELIPKKEMPFEEFIGGF